MSEIPESDTIKKMPTSIRPEGRRYEPFRFLHASDFRLHQPLIGLSDIPPQMKEVLASAPYIAAERVFDAAISERVAFVLLSGNLVDLDFGGPRAIAFLLSQFERLGKRNIQVFWCGGEIDLLDRWPTSIELPSNVKMFPSTLVDSASVSDGKGKVLAHVIGASFDLHRSHLKDFQSIDAEGFPIGLTCGLYDINKLAGHGVKYWALGGQTKRNISSHGGTAYAYPGTPQGRNDEAQGAHGAVLVSVEASGQLRTQSVDVEVARWMNLSLSVAETVSMDALKDVLADRALQVTSKFPDANLLVNWHIATTGEYSTEFRKQENRLALVKWLRHEFGGSPGLWTVDLTISPSQMIPKVWFEEDTIQGDFLRELSRYRNNPELAIQLHGYDIGQEEFEGVGRLSKIEKSDRELLLDDVILEGIDRLGGNEA